MGLIVPVAASLVVSLGFLLGGAASAYAQSTRRPDLNQFGRGLRDPEQSLSVGGNLGASFYDTIMGPPSTTGAPTGPDHGWGSFASTALIYKLKLLNMNFDGSLGAVATYYPVLPNPLAINATPTAGLNTSRSWAVSDKTQLNVGASLSYRSLYAESILPGAAPPSFNDPSAAFVPLQAALVDGSYLTYGTNATVHRTLSRRWGLTGSYDVQRENVFNEDPQNQYGARWSQRGSAVTHFSVTRNLSVHGGYRYDESHIDGGTNRTHGLDLGADYGRGVVLQLARRTKLAANGGAAAFVDQTGQQRYRLTGDVDLTHDFKRTWSSGARYSRGIETSQILFTGPVLTDTFTAFLNGLLSRRVGAHASADVQGGALAFGTPNTDSFRSTVGAGVQTSFGRKVAFSVDYRYYYSRFDEGIRLPTGLLALSESQGVFAYLSFWAPIFERGGRPHATR